MLFPSFFNAGPATYEIEQSLRFDGSSYLSWTPGSAGNRRTSTFSVWFKPTTTGGEGVFFNATGYTKIAIDAGGFDKIWFQDYDGTVRFRVNPSGSYRDPSAWYHLVAVLDTTNATSTERVKIYINGVRLDTFDTNSQPSQNFDTDWANNVQHRIGADTNPFYFNGYMAECHFVDGTALDPTDFGEFDNNGVWRPKRYTGSHGTNGFYLKFDPSATNGIGHDHSGNGNNWTANGFFNEIGTPDYNANWIGSTSGSIYSGSWENVFNGDVTVGSNYVYVYNQTATCTFSTPLNGEIEVFASNGASVGGSGTMQVSLSDGSTYNVANVTRVNTPWYSFGTKSNITSITITSSGGGNHGTILGAIRVDGDLLVNESAKAGYDNFSDTPTTNWCTLNPLGGAFQTRHTLSDGNLVYTQSSNTGQAATMNSQGTIGVSSGKWYWEISNATNQVFGFMQSQNEAGNYQTTGGWVYSSGTDQYGGVTGFSHSNSIGSSDVIGMALDMDNNTCACYKNNSLMGTFTTIPDGTYFPTAAVFSSGSSGGATYNFGQRAFTYTPPTGFKALNTSNLPAPTVKDGSKNFSANTWTGNGTTNNALTGFGHQPDFVWGKARNQAYAHVLFDSIRGGDKRVYNNGSTPPAQDTNSEYIKSFDSDGITLGSDANLNGNNVTYVGWSWKGGGTVSAGNNTTGTITTTVSANPTGGFSVIKYTSNGTSGATIGHGLGDDPAFFIVKNIDATDHYSCYHQGIGNGKALLLNSGNSAYTDVAFWNNTSPTSTVITLGNETSTNNSNSDDYICWAWAEVEGYSKFGSYTGNGSTDGVFIYTGFKVAWWLVKRTDSTEYWYIRDTTRDDTNPISIALNPNSSDVEGSYGSFDFLSNGIKIRESGTGSNTSGGTYIYAAFASSPFGGSGVSPATAR